MIVIMAFRRGSGSLSTRTKARYRASVGTLLFISVIAPLTILAGQASKLFTSGGSYLLTGSLDLSETDDIIRRSALEAVESHIPQEVPTQEDLNC